MMKKILRSAAALALSVSMLMGTTALAATTAFNDVQPSHWAYSHIYKAVQNGLISGNGDGTYAPDSTVALKDFGTMICSLMYPGADKAYAGQSAYWWYQYVEALYMKGALAGTSAGAKRAADGRWTATYVEKTALTRYDMAQIIYNAAKSQGWAEPSSTETAYAYLALASEAIPSQYTQAVVYCYAKGFLAGMGDGTFSGNKSMTRAQAAVVLNALYEAKKKVDAPSYSNSKYLVNGKEPTEDNVAKAVSDLRSDFPAWSTWSMDRSYTSGKLGSAVGSQAFAYMFSDKVFGNMSASEQTDTDKIKVGDLVHLRDEGRYGVVTAVNSKDFEYVYCDSMGLVSWSGSLDIDDLDSRDTIWSRYEGKNTTSLANGDKATERNVRYALEDLEDDRDYEHGEEWTEDEYESDALGEASDENESFAYAVSDEIFGDLESYKVKSPDIDDLRVGDVVIVDDGYEFYAVVLDVDHDNDSFYCAYADNYYDDDEYIIYWDWDDYYYDIDDLDTLYSRYPDDVDDDDDDDDDYDDDELTNGEAAKESNVEDYLWDDFYDDDDYGDGVRWDVDKQYSTSMGKVKGDQAFAYMLSDEIFGDDADDYDITRVKDIQVGDIIYYYGDYGIIVEIDGDDFTYATLDDRDRITWDAEGSFDGDFDFDEGDEVISRYPD